ncbi:LuxR C-terminal-related transcriptional regulator [Elizabethkingia meningoseptica]|uniref:LuxR C-terminal-related transcriptional regulator n=1 Tax=Elizabethkingia meningoseptica TaxID=238 RepID=UPI0009364F0B|nr:LuxR C-terminal-related transcriptional regulator [Elizabethkingia meningoseptica]
MKNKIPPIDAQQYYDFYKVDSDAIEKNYLDVFSDTIDSMKKFAVGPYFCYISNNIKMRIPWVSDNVDQFTPYSKEEWLDSDSQFFMNLFHPDDIFYLLGAFEFASKFGLSLLTSNKKNEMYFNFYSRMINPKGEYRWILLQSPQQCTTSNHQAEAALVVITDLSHFQISSMPLLSIIDHHKKEIQYFKHFDQEAAEIEMKRPNITKREKEILKLMAQGLKSPQIAEKLSISYHTVERHKDNLRGKTNSKTAAELIAYTMTHSLLLL